MKKKEGVFLALPFSHPHFQVHLSIKLKTSMYHLDIAIPYAIQIWWAFLFSKSGNTITKDTSLTKVDTFLYPFFFHSSCILNRLVLLAFLLGLISIPKWYVQSPIFSLLSYNTEIWLQKTNLVGTFYSFFRVR